jgi:hypothetical protein
MRFAVDDWDVSYGSSTELDDLEDSNAEVDLGVEVDAKDWVPIDPVDFRVPGSVLFVDGVRRIEARVWIDGEVAAPVEAGICASYAAGVVCCCAERAHVLDTQVRRSLFTTSALATDISTRAGTYGVRRARRKPGSLTTTLSLALQSQLAEVEQEVSRTAAAGLADHISLSEEDYLLLVDGPLHHGRTDLPRAVGYIKSHRTEYLPIEQNAIVSSLAAGQRTPVFRIGTSWLRNTWYVRLPGRCHTPWTGIVRLEASPNLTSEDVISLANLTQTLLGRYASAPHKEKRAPQNLYPIAGLENHLRHRLGDQRVMYRALRIAADRY